MAGPLLRLRDSAVRLCQAAAEAATRLLTVTSTVEQIRSLLSDDPVLLAVPRIAENRLQACSYVIDPHRPGRLVLCHVLFFG